MSEILRLDEDPALGGVGVPSTPSNNRQAATMVRPSTCWLALPPVFIVEVLKSPPCSYN